MSDFINVNGKILPAPSINAYNNSAFRYGYGLFETMLFKDGHIQLKQYHWERLFSGMRQLQFSVPETINPAWLEEETLKTVQKNKLEKLCRVRLQVFSTAGGLYDSKDKFPQFIIECFPLERSSIELNENGLVLGIAEGLQKSNDSLANLKTCSGLIYIMAAKQTTANKWDDALISNTADNIIESTIANIFWIKNKEIFTPPLSEGCIAGVMRRFIFTSLAEKGISVRENSLSKQTLLQADEIFLTNAIRGIKWVKNVGELSIYKCKSVEQIHKNIYDFQ